ncbi:MAG: DUF4255 domain-containing protein [Chloroflexi bacterium]|nr:DUF4255 domain-containing protein [Chloroflexota bacterium]
MTSALAIAAITSVLKDLLDNRLAQRGVAGDIGDVTVTALPPDRIPIGAEERTQLNLFMYRVTPRTRWRPAPNGNGAGFAPPLELDLHYLLTAYGEEDLHAEIVLGYAVQLLHETPVLSRDAIRTTLTPASQNGSSRVLAPARAAVSASSLADQLEQITICPEFLSMEETTKLWSALQAHYRPSAVYEVSAVLIDAER